MKKLLTAVLLCAVFFLSVLPIAVYAAPVSVELKVTTGTVYPGCTLSVCVFASGNNIMIMQGKPLEYDTSLLTLAEDPAPGLNSWQYAVGGSNFIVENPRFETASGSGLQMLVYRFRLSSSAKIGSSLTFRIKNLIVSTSDGNAQNGFSGDVSLTVKIEERPKSTNAALSSLSIDGVTLVPAFSSSVTAYTATVPYTVTSLKVSARTSSDAAKYSVTGGSDLQYGENRLEVEVTAESGAKAVYTVVVTRTPPPSKDAALSALSAEGYVLTPEFDPSSTSYAITVPADVTSVKLTAAAKDAKAKVKIVGDGDLVIGENTVTVTVTAEDGVSVCVYTLHVTRLRPVDTDAHLAVLTFGEYETDPLFAPDSDVTEYTVTVPYEVNSIALLNVSLRSSYATYEVNSPEFFEVGSNTVSIVCRAEDGETVMNYTLTVIRNARILNTDSSIRSLTYDKGTMTPKFSPDVYSYMIITEPDPGSLTFKAEPNDPAASAETVIFIPAPGLNEQTVTCTAEDGSTSVYTIYVYTPPTADPHLYLNGIPAVGNTVTTQIDDAGAGGSFRWFIDGKPSETDTGSSYRVKEEDAGKAIYAEYTDPSGKTIRSQTLSVPASEAETKQPESETPDTPQRNVTELIVVLILAVFCIGAGVIIGIFFTKKSQHKNK
ncbi:MAG: cadherin-like beta sandwich domain-containing protein [Clostridia bacterium]|nr:cadherin-like beta sandwich domain-containing protein [Clostridia bacterium]